MSDSRDSAMTATGTPSANPRALAPETPELHESHESGESRKTQESHASGESCESRESRYARESREPRPPLVAPQRSWSAPVHAACTSALLRLPPSALPSALDALGLATYASVNARLRREVTRAYEGFAETTGQRIDARRAMRDFWRAWPVRGEAPALVRYGSDTFHATHVRITGWEHLEGALAGRRGAVIASVHAGCGSLPAAFASRRGIRVMTLRSEALARHAGTARGRHLFFGTEPAFVDFDRGGDVSVLKAGVEMLARNGIVSILCDHRLSGRSVEAQLFSRDVAYRTSFLEAARLAGAPVVPAFGRASRHGFAIEFHECSTLTSPRETAEFVGRFAALHEAFLREAPDQLGFVGFETQLFCPWAAPSLVSRFGRFQ